MTSHQRSTLSRVSRQRFTQRYGSTSYNIISSYVASDRSLSSQELAQTLGVAVGTVRTTLGNFTRGAYGSIVDDCNFTSRHFRPAVR